MKSPVYFLKSSSGKLPKDKFIALLKKTGWISNLAPKSLVALKLHFGEEGNKGQIAPEYVAQFVKDIKSRNGKPFMVETGTLYAGNRSNAYDHMMLAFKHGYTYEAVGAPIIMADGVRGQAKTKVKINGQHLKEIDVASDARVYDAMLVLTHVTGHLASGLGGTIKNLGMGLSSRAGKLVQHSGMKPEVLDTKCTACNSCSEWCPANAIGVHEGDTAAKINAKLCIGCGECLTVCPVHAIKYDWNADKLKFQEKMAEYALGIVTGREKTITYVSFLTSVTRNCDCMGNDNETFFDDIGVLASTDPVAIDQASIDLVNKARGTDFFRESFPAIDPCLQLVHGEKIGLGSREYEIIEI